MSNPVPNLIELRRYDVGGAVAQYASADQSPRKASRTADPLAAVVAAGARAVGRTLTEELHLGHAAPPPGCPRLGPGSRWGWPQCDLFVQSFR